MFESNLLLNGFDRVRARTLRRRHYVSGGAPVKNVGGGGAAWAVKFSTHTCFNSFF